MRIDSSVEVPHSTKTPTQLTQESKKCIKICMLARAGNEGNQNVIALLDFGESTGKFSKLI